MAIKPTFNYPKKDKKGTSEAVTITEHDKQPEKKVEKKKKKINSRKGASLGWGWFQGFNLFVTLYFFTGFMILGYFMLGGDYRHDGPPKYTLDRANIESGQVIFNPQIPELIRRTYQYVPPVMIPIVTRDELESIVAVKKPPLELIAEQNKGEDKPNITLISNIDGEESLETNVQGREYQAEEYIEMAEMALSIGHLVGTNKDDAYYYYQQVLTLDPNNVSAKEGIASIANIYYQNADKAMYRGEYSLADQYIKVGLIIEPDNPLLQNLERELEFLIQTN